MTLLGGESLLNDATALNAYKVALAAAIGTAASWTTGLVTFALAAGGSVVIGVALGAVIDYIRARLNDPLVESAVGLIAPPRLRLEMLAAERASFIAERDSGHLDDEVLRSVFARTRSRGSDAQPDLSGSRNPFHLQHIAHRGACGKTGVMPQNRWPKPELARNRG